MGVVSKANNALRVLGIDLGRMANTIGHVPRFIRDVRSYRRATGAANGTAEPKQDVPEFPFAFRNLKPILVDYTDAAGGSSGHYFFQDLWAARRIFETRPARHVDIGSRIDGFVAHVLSFMPVEIIDIRPMSSNVPGLTFMQADATDLKWVSSDSVESLSCLHAVEHFGLGRYTDPIQPDAWLNAARAMQRVLLPGGKLYFSVPIGRQRVEFNAHRIFNPHTIVKAFDGLELVSWAAVDDSGEFRPEAKMEDYVNARYSCGLYEFRKPK